MDAKRRKARRKPGKGCTCETKKGTRSPAVLYERDPVACKTGTVQRRGMCTGCGETVWRTIRNRRAQYEHPEAWTRAQALRAQERERRLQQSWRRNARGRREAQTPIGLEDRMHEVSILLAMGAVLGGARDEAKRPETSGPRERTWRRHYEDGDLDGGLLGYVTGALDGLVLLPGTVVRDDGAALCILDSDDDEKNGMAALGDAVESGLAVGYILENPTKRGRFHIGVWLKRGVRPGNGPWKGDSVRGRPLEGKEYGGVVRLYPGEAERIAASRDEPANGRAVWARCCPILGVKPQPASQRGRGAEPATEAGDAAVSPGGREPEVGKGAVTDGAGPARRGTTRNQARRGGWYGPPMPRPRPGSRHNEHFEYLANLANRWCYEPGATPEGVMRRMAPVVNELRARTPDCSGYPPEETDRIARCVVAYHSERAARGQPPFSGETRWTAEQCWRGGVMRGLQQRLEAISSGRWPAIARMLRSGMTHAEIRAKTGCGGWTIQRVLRWMRRIAGPGKAAPPPPPPPTETGIGWRVGPVRRPWGRVCRETIRAWFAVTDEPIWWYQGARPPP